MAESCHTHQCWLTSKSSETMTAVAAEDTTATSASQFFPDFLI